jgi:hypothetical protein
VGWLNVSGACVGTHIPTFPDPQSPTKTTFRSRFIIDEMGMLFSITDRGGLVVLGDALLGQGSRGRADLGTWLRRCCYYSVSTILVQRLHNQSINFRHAVQSRGQAR